MHGVMAFGADPRQGEWFPRLCRRIHPLSLDGRPRSARVE